MIKFLRDWFVGTTVPDGEKKVRNLIAFFASEHERLTQKPLSVTSLHKYLALLDQGSLKKVGRPALGLSFRRLARRLTDSWVRRETQSDSFVLILRGGEYSVKAVGKPDLSCFSSYELDEMHRLVNINVLRKVLHTGFSFLETDDTKRFDTTDADFPDDTQEKGWGEIKNAAMDAARYSVFTKHQEVDQMTGLSLLMERYEAQLKELERQMAEIKHRLEIVTEASRLLKEEGLSENEQKPGWS